MCQFKQVGHINTDKDAGFPIKSFGVIKVYGVQGNKVHNYEELNYTDIYMTNHKIDHA
jgi:hypothetical protein